MIFEFYCVFKMFKYDILLAAAVSPSLHWSPLRRNNDQCFIIQGPGGDQKYWRIEDRSGYLPNLIQNVTHCILMKWKEEERGYRLERMGKIEAGE